MAYRVRRGGSPMDSGVVLFSAVDAQECALNMAREIATVSGLSPRHGAIYGRDGLGGVRLWGACPEGDDGAYYPVITVEN